MMYAPLYARAMATPAVVALLDDGKGSIRLWPFGEQPKAPGPNPPPPKLPYVTWQNIGGDPNNNVSDRPDADRFSIQVNVWAATSVQLWAVTTALRDIMEVEGCTIVRWGNTEIDAQTKAFGYDFDADWITYR